MAFKLQKLTFLLCNNFPSNMSVFRNYLGSLNFRGVESGMH